ncbi:MAG: hypothetical protein MUE30_05665 [Spirosomaceae bacterium]|nr:hypothetical protein [Spirosomataceae bacterium]
MKPSNILLTVVAFGTILAQVLLVFGYKEAYQLEVANQAVIHPFGTAHDTQPFKTIVTNRVAFRVNLTDKQQGYTARYSQLDDMKQIEFRAQNDTLYITNLKRSQNVDFELFFSKMPYLVCRNSQVIFRDMEVDSVQLLARSLTWVHVEKCNFGYLKAEFQQKSNINFDKKSEVGYLEVRLKDETRLSAHDVKIGKIKLTEVSEKAAVQLSGASFKAVQ